MVLYEVAKLEVLTSDAYLARLNNPTPWTARMMPHYRRVCRGLCAVTGSFGFGQGGAATLFRFTSAPAQANELQQWLLREALPSIPESQGLGSAHLLRGAQPAAMTNEQRIRGADGSVDSALIITGHDTEALAVIAEAIGGTGGLLGHGAVDVVHATYSSAYTLTAAEVDA